MQLETLIFNTEKKKVHVSGLALITSTQFIQGVTTPLGRFGVFIHEFMSGCVNYSMGGTVRPLRSHIIVSVSHGAVKLLAVPETPISE